MELAVIGRGDFTLGFRLAGIRKTHEVDEGSINSTVQQALKDPDIGILITVSYTHLRAHET